MYVYYHSFCLNIPAFTAMQQMIRPKDTKTQSRRNISGIDSAVSKSRHISCALSVVYCECVNRPDICSISKVGRLNQPESIRAPLKSALLDVSFTLTRHL